MKKIQILWVLMMMSMVRVAEAASFSANGKPKDSVIVCLLGLGGDKTCLKDVLGGLQPVLAVVAILAIVWGGIQWIIGGINGMEDKVSKGKKAVVLAAIGLAIIYLAKPIVDAVQRFLGV